MGCLEYAIDKQHVDSTSVYNAIYDGYKLVEGEATLLKESLKIVVNNTAINGDYWKISKLLIEFNKPFDF